MFSIEEKMSFSLNFYNFDNGILKSNILIPDDVYSTFKLPKDTDVVEIKKFDNNGSKSILRIYLGQEKTFKELLDVMVDKGRKIEFIKDIDIKTIDFDNSRLYYVYKSYNINFVKKVLDVNEIVLESLEEIENYIKKLSRELGKLNRQSDKVRKLIRNN